MKLTRSAELRRQLPSEAVRPPRTSSCCQRWSLRLVGWCIPPKAPSPRETAGLRPVEGMRFVRQSSRRRYCSASAWRSEKRRIMSDWNRRRFSSQIAPSSPVSRLFVLISSSNVIASTHASPILLPIIVTEVVHSQKRL